MQWTLDQLRQFVTAVDCGSFSGAARRLGRAQSAISSAIGLLEADLGFDLFDRSRRNAVLTDAGKVMLLEARELLRQAEGLDHRAQAFATDQEARLTLALDEALPYTAVGTMVHELAQEYPSLELTLLHGTAAEVAGYVEQQQADIAFHFDRGPLAAAFEQRHVGSVVQGVFVAHHHPLTEHPEVNRRDLARHRQLVIHSVDVQEPALSPSVWRSDSFYTIGEMVADGLGWAVLPLNIARYDTYRRHLVELPCPSLALSPLSVRMLWSQGKTLGATASWVQRRLSELLRNGHARSNREA
jgi:DNA-binding transcriptional LysR family regulator